MAILVEEGLRPDGTDLVVGDRKVNGFARAKAEGRPIVKALDLGDDFALAGVTIQPMLDEAKENLCFLLVCAAGPVSPLVGIQPVPTIVAELGRIPLAELKAGVARALQPQEQA